MLGRNPSFCPARSLHKHSEPLLWSHYSCQKVNGEWTCAIQIQYKLQIYSVSHIEVDKEKKLITKAKHFCF